MTMYFNYLLSFLVILSIPIQKAVVIANNIPGAGIAVKDGDPTSSSGGVVLQYPVKDQLPLIARAGQQYSWTISDKTFASPNGSSLKISAKQAPPWLSFDGGTGTLSGTPSLADEGSVTVVLSADGDGGDGASDEFTLCVTRFPPPVSQIPLQKQFNGSNPSFSSVFPLRNNSALASGYPAVRVPLHWSFSVGFEGNTYAPAIVNGSTGDLLYYALQADGTPLPSWLSFDAHTMTFDGVARSPSAFEGEVVSVALISSDQPGYSAYHDIFDIVVASHELNIQQGPQPAISPINATQGEQLDFNFKESDWVFDGILLDSSTIRGDNISRLEVDTSSVSWLTYDVSSTTLRGNVPASSTGTETSATLPVKLTALNQTLDLNVTINTLPSYFTKTSLDSLYVAPGSDVDLALGEFISRNTFFANHDISLNATLDPSASSSFLNFGAQSGKGQWALTGTVPSDVSLSHVNVTFSAYDHTAHAESHLTAFLAFKIGANGNNVANGNRNGALARRRRLELGIGIAGGVIVTAFLLFGGLAIVRKCCSVQDDAVGVDSYADTREKGYLGDASDDLDVEVMGVKLGYGWTEKAGAEGDPAAILRNMPSSTSPQYRSPYPGIGNGVSPHMHDAYNMVSKGAFFNGVKQAVRKVSGAATASVRRASASMRNNKKAMISKPVLMFTKDSEASLRRLQEAAGVGMDVGAGMDLPRYAVGNHLDGSDLGSSPTGSDGSNMSVPVQRPDFGPPRATLASVAANKATAVATPAQVKTKVTKLPKEVVRQGQDERHLRRRSSDTQHTQSSGDVEEAVIVTASRAPSIRSAHSSYSYARDSQAQGANITMPVPSLPTHARPRLVQFTSARGVPTPALDPQRGGDGMSGANRRVSQVAAVVNGIGNEDADAIMTEGMRYVQAFGGNQVDVVVEPTRTSNLGGGSSIASQSRRSSRSIGVSGGAGSSKAKLSPSMASTHSPVPTQSTSSYVYPSPSASFDSELNSRGSLVMRRILVRAGEQFSFNFPVMLPVTPGSTPASGTSSASRNASKNNIVARLLYGGGALPNFLVYSVITAPSPKKSSSSSSKKSGDGTVEVEFWGTPGKKDVGEVFVGLFDVSGGQEVCVGKLAVDVVTGR
ncbi:hypothetical protein SCHPADRAFT_995248 [Schizopora paradoxa]|uniref:Dystroglycan-type cadherin-like domain-containing protein n=1 Tax=Schizopora paradoxa TaxID=27342 RepID=A0A0H2SGQ6_9AGAM|nr:hypothetical protein SCHPADRAFT_995248 [Schizopora paradoxa]